MAGTKEIRLKIKSVQNTRKITKAMEMVAASKMKKAQERMRRGRPYAQRLLNITMHAANANTEYKHPLLTRRANVKRVGVVVVTTDKGLCGGLNTNLLRLVLNQHKEWLAKGIEAEYCTIGNKGLGFVNRMGGRIVSQVVNYGDHPTLDRLIGPVKMLIDGFLEGRLDEVHIFSTRFINTMKQEPTQGAMIPIPQEWVLPTGQVMKAEVGAGNWDYLYEPDAKAVLDQLLVRYLETVVYQAAIDNIASEQSARMVAMKAASDNARNIIDELQLVYNKSRQAAITKELSEIVGGAAAV
ncbi:MAG: F0F1 ATP synthase subunit gamma [Gammaproteobacteria bacterium]|nr:F0F1 ATP synthase subunit gamma [Gammaproteobacteria bacterium]MDH5176038.1 F0F1 ATP synthase subunit gamma [Gammaproteobacteria bacterium]MDH5226500.1 F0F1 ATP synthase subunit gamma [Gammaproteobacteria bacterium]